MADSVRRLAGVGWNGALFEVEQDVPGVSIPIPLSDVDWRIAPPRQQVGCFLREGPVACSLKGREKLAALC